MDRYLFKTTQIIFWCKTLVNFNFFYHNRLFKFLLTSIPEGDKLAHFELHTNTCILVANSKF